MRGAKRKPTVLKLIAGKPGHMPLPVNEPIPEGDIQTPPKTLTKEQRSIWTRVVDDAPAGLLRSLDFDLFLEWVCAVAVCQQAEKELQKHGHIVKLGGSIRTTTNKEGVVAKTVRSDSWIVSPWAKLRDAAFQRMVRATSELGFSPTSRARITLPGGEAAKKKDANRFSRNRRRA